MTGLFTSAQTVYPLHSGPNGSTTAIYITDIKFSTFTDGQYRLMWMANTAGGLTSGTVWTDTFFAPKGGENANLRNPVVLRTGSALALTSTITTSHSCVVCGFIGPDGGV